MKKLVAVAVLAYCLLLTPGSSYGQFSPPAVGAASTVPYSGITGLTANEPLYGGAAGVPSQSPNWLFVDPLLTLKNNGIGSTPTDSLVLSNSTAAAAGAQQYSPAIHWTGQGWKTTSTAASQAVEWRAYVVPVQGSSAPTSQWNLDSSVNGGAFGNQMNVSSNGLIQTNGGVYGAYLRTGSSGNLNFYFYSKLGSPADGQFTILNQAGNAPGIAATNTGDVAACYNGTSFQLTYGASCGVSLAKYKRNITPFQHGLDYVMRMEPVTFRWKDSGKPDIGMIADKLAAIDPLLGAYDKDGKLYNFKDREVLAVLVKAVQELQEEVQELKKENVRLAKK